MGISKLQSEKIAINIEETKGKSKTKFPALDLEIF